MQFTGLDCERNSPWDTCRSWETSSLTATSSSRFIVSSNYPDDYKSDETCTWTISVSWSETRSYIQLRVVDIELEDSYDHLIVDDGVYEYKFQNEDAGAMFVSTTSTINVRFTSDVSDTRKGFRIEYYQTDYGQTTVIKQNKGENSNYDPFDDDGELGTSTIIGIVITSLTVLFACCKCCCKFCCDDDETVVEGPDPVPVPGEQNPDPQEMEPLSNGVSTGVPPTIIPTTAMPSAPPAPTGYSPPPNYDNYDYGTKPVPFEYPTTTTTDITSNVEGGDGAGGLPPPPTYDDVFTDPHGYLYSSHNV